MRRTRASIAVLIFVVAGSILVGNPGALAGPSIRAVRVAAGLDQPVGFTFDSRGRIWYVEKATGEVRVLDSARHTDRLFYRFSGVSSLGERGTLGIAIHPDYPATPFVYVYVTRHGPGHPLQNQIVRLRSSADTLLPVLFIHLSQSWHGGLPSGRAGSPHAPSRSTLTLVSGR